MLNEIKKQPEHIRVIFMWLCVIITFSIIGYVWFIDFQNHIVAMANPESVIETNQFFAQVSGPLSGFKNSLKDLGATLGNAFEFLSGGKETVEEGMLEISNQPKPQLLPETRN